MTGLSSLAHPGRRPDRSSRVARFLPLIALWLLGVVAVAAAGLVATPSAESADAIRLTDAYPVDGVTTTVLAITLEVAGLAALLRPRTFRRSWIRAILALVLACLFLFFSIAAIMDAPPYAHVYAQWAFGVVLILLLLSAWTVVASAVAWTSAKRGRRAARTAGVP